MIIVSNGLAELELEDFKPLTQILQSSFNVDPDSIIASMHNMLQYFYFKNNKLIAVVSLKRRGRLLCNTNEYPNVIYNVATAPRYRGKGYMKELFQFIIQHQKNDCRMRCMHLQVLSNNTPAINLYKSLGFKIRLSDGCKEVIHMRLCLINIKPSITTFSNMWDLIMRRKKI